MGVQDRDWSAGPELESRTGMGVQDGDGSAGPRWESRTGMVVRDRGGSAGPGWERTEDSPGGAALVRLQATHGSVAPRPRATTQQPAAQVPPQSAPQHEK